MRSLLYGVHATRVVYGEPQKKMYLINSLPPLTITATRGKEGDWGTGLFLSHYLPPFLY
jgi:hypothetical protein